VSDLARVYAPGSEPAKGNQTGGLPYPNGKELATVANSGLAVSQAPGKEVTKLPLP
jgi:hypothetical protein